MDRRRMAEQAAHRGRRPRSENLSAVAPGFVPRGSRSDSKAAKPMICFVDQFQPLNGCEIEATTDGYRNLTPIARPMRRHARDMDAKSCSEIVIRSFPLPVGL
jgi:hypothetical protein